MEKKQRIAVNKEHSSCESFVFVVPDVTVSRPVLQEPAVGCFVLPADVVGVLPQKSDLIAGVASVPQCVSQVLTRARD